MAEQKDFWSNLSQMGTALGSVTGAASNFINTFKPQGSPTGYNDPLSSMYNANSQAQKQMEIDAAKSKLENSQRNASLTRNLIIGVSVLAVVIVLIVMYKKLFKK